MNTSETDPFFDAMDPHPGFYDVYKKSELTLPKRLARRYFITNNYERSIKIHERLGSKILRSIVMNTTGRLRREHHPSNYHLGDQGSPLDRAAKFAFKGSVYNEVVHGTIGYPAAMFTAYDWIENGPHLTGSAINAVFNLGLVAVQRYNRARMIGYLDHALHSGREFTPNYESWTDVDSSSLAAAKLAMAQEFSVIPTVEEAQVPSSP